LGGAGLHTAQFSEVVGETLTRGVRLEIYSTNSKFAKNRVSRRTIALLMYFEGWIEEKLKKKKNVGEGEKLAKPILRQRTTGLTRANWGR